MTIVRDEWESSGDNLPELVTATVENGHVWLTMEMENGDVIHVGDHSGLRAEYLAELLSDFGDDLYEYLADCVYEENY